MKIAVIDIGTNSIHMLMAEIHPNFTFEVIGREKEMTRLGDGTLSTGSLSPEALKRGLTALKKFKILAKNKGIQKIISNATSAVREARNGGDFIKRIKNETDIKVQIITGEEEGRLIYLGVKNSLELGEKNSLIIDIGGGSVEFIVANSKKILFLRSLKMGASRLKALLEKESRKEFERLEKHIEELMEETAETIQSYPIDQVIGTSGTINNLAAIAFYKKEASSQSTAKNSSLDFEDLKEIYGEIQKSTSDERAKMKGLDPLRNDLILTGSAIAYTIMKVLKIKTINACDKAVREGMVYDYISKNRNKIKLERLIPNVRRRNILRLATKCDYPKTHAEQVSDLAVQIFDEMKTVHPLSNIDRELLEYAALLHNIGYYINYEKHHRHAFYLIKNSHLNGFSEEEINILAHVVRYHRSSEPKKGHTEFHRLSKAVKQRILWLASFLKIADSLDRTHFSVIQSIEISKRPQSLKFNLQTRNDAEYELWEVQKKCALLSRLTDRTISFEVKKRRGNRSSKKKNSLKLLNLSPLALHSSLG